MFLVWFTSYYDIILFSEENRGKVSGKAGQSKVINKLKAASHYIPHQGYLLRKVTAYRVQVLSSFFFVFYFGKVKKKSLA